MSIRIVFQMVVIKKSAVRKHYPDGEAGFRTAYPFAAEDRYLFGLGSMSGGELEEILQELTAAGLDLPECAAIADCHQGAIEEHPDIRFERVSNEPFAQWSARLACDDPDEMAAEGAPIVQWLMEKGWALSLPDDPREPPKKAPARAKVTRVPHDGRLIFGGKGSLTPFRPKPTASPATQSPQPDEALDILAPGQEDPEPAMKGARISLETSMAKWSQEAFDEEMAARAARRQSTDSPETVQDSTTRKPSGQA
ncbi:hypothetical protein ZRA01_29640 [Zoogloea ramigera]|uniref:Uncharacterized protein n=1 Tax=Zoogloea ramigera TaxID=350 RepID=A0A4Y4CVG8_ZOORA|nr:hypothetical protein [Zoogloea ramigera]GEC96891.1 hypothetical protein ZRA01_29640 [Zoogloea ramigera]